MSWPIPWMSCQIESIVSTARDHTLGYSDIPRGLMVRERREPTSWIVGHPKSAHVNINHHPNYAPCRNASASFSSFGARYPAQTILEWLVVHSKSRTELSVGSGQSRVSVVGDHNPQNQDSHLGSEVFAKQSARDLPTYPQELSEPMGKRAFDHTQAVAELAARQGPRWHILTVRPALGAIWRFCRGWHPWA